jgi:hypothetical protein
MEQKFVKFDEALAKLGITADRLNQLREDGELRAYRDGASWKFRADEIDRMASDGVPEPPPPSDIGLASADELVESSPLESLPELDEEFRLADDDDTVTAGGSDAQLNLAPDEPSDPSDSILLSDETLGESSQAPPSTIIGRSELEAKDADLDLVLEGEDDDEVGSDVRLAAGASDVHSAGIAGSGVLDDEEKSASHASAFEKLEELEIDLAAESSRILNPSEAAEFKGTIGGGGKGAKKPDSDLSLQDVELSGADEGTDPVPEEVASGKKNAKPDTGPTSDLELATGDDDDFVLAEAGGSDITLDSGDSGINLISPSDSGLALDDIPLEMGGSAILESLNLSSDPGESEISLVGSDINEKQPPAKGKAKQPAALQTDDDFRLTPLGDADDEGDSSSQVIALDESLGDVEAPAAGILGEDAFAEMPEGEGVGFEEEYPTGDDAGLEMAGYAPVAARESEYTMLNILALGSCVVLLLFGTVVMMDMIRNIWAWDESFALNDSLLDSILGMFGLST